MPIDWKKKILSEAFSDKEIPKKNRPETPPPVPVVKQEQPGKVELDPSLVKNLKDAVIKEIKSNKLIDVVDLKNGHAIVYPSKKVQDLRWHGSGAGGVTKIIAGDNITISSTGSTPGTGEVTINTLDFYDAFIAPSGADYTTVRAAIEDGKKTLCVMGDTTETAQIVLTSDTYIYIKYGATVDMGEFDFTNTVDEELTLWGDGVLRWAFSAPHSLVDLGQDVRLTINGLTLTNESSAGNTFVGDDAQERVTNVVFNLPNAAAGGVKGTRDGCFYSNIRFVGGGANCTLALQLASANIGPLMASNIQLTGTFKASSATATDAIVDLDYQGVLSGLSYLGNFGAIRINATDQCALSNVMEGESGMIDLYAGSSAGRYVHLTNIDCHNGSIIIAGNGVKLANAETTTLDMSAATSTDCLLTDCIVGYAGVVTVGGDKHKFSNVTFINGATVVSGADDNGFSNCQFGDLVGGGVSTLTVNAGSNRTRIVGCMTDVAISDAGTGTVTAANTIY